MTIWIMPEFDTEGRAVCLFWLQGGKQNKTPTEKKTPFSRKEERRTDFKGGGKHNSFSRSIDLAKLNPNCHMNYSNYF